MKSNNAWRIRLAQLVLGATIVIALVMVRGAKAGNKPVHLVTDWSHRHLVFSSPKSLMKRFQFSSDPRYVQQLLRRHAGGHGDPNEWRWRRAPEDPKHFHGDWSEDMGSGATVGAGNYPAKYSFDTSSANCASASQPDFVVYNTSLAGSTSQATIVAFDNLYSSCTGGTPQTYWAFNTGTTGAVVTSPVLSFDGSQVAFIQNTGGAANLVILRWKAGMGTLTSPVTPPAGPCTALTAPCMITIPFSTGNGGTGADSFSSPFYDYPSDTLYVGDDSGFLHEFIGVFLSTPSEVVCTSSSVTATCQLPAGTNLWPASLTGGFGHLNSPVYVDNFTQILVTGNDGVLYSVNPTIGGVIESGSVPLGYDFTTKLANIGFDDGPLVDPVEGYMYLFARADAANVAGIFQIAIPATPFGLFGDTITEAVVSNSSTTPASAFYIGTFDNLYYTNANGTGNLYACSTSGTVNAIWGIEINSNVMSAPAVGPTISTSNVGCSPITEFYNSNTNTKLMFLSVTGSPVTASPISCPSAGSGCIMSFNIGSPLLSSSGTSAVASETGGTSGIIVDNDSTTTGASQVYFTPLAEQTCATSGGTGGCAIQASQSGLN